MISARQSREMQVGSALLTALLLASQLSSDRAEDQEGKSRGRQQPKVPPCRLTGGSLRTQVKGSIAHFP